jgi:hypothetical protein
VHPHCHDPTIFDGPCKQTLAQFDANLFQSTECYFAGGTAIALALSDYRESVDVDYLCSSADGYRMQRETAFDQGFAGLTKSR